MKIEEIDGKYNRLHEVISLYKSAFPKNERDSVRHLLHHPKNEGDLIAFTDGDIFCGFAYLLTYKDITHILYFAIDEKLRHKGYGAEALKEICDLKKGRVIVDVEKEEPSDNLTERINRVNFYLHNGFKPTDICYAWKGVDYQILSNGEITVDDFDGFWAHFEFDEDMGEFLYKTFKKI